MKTRLWVFAIFFPLAFFVIMNITNERFYRQNDRGVQLESNKLLCFNDESQEVRFEKEDEMNKMKVEFTSNSIVEGVKNNLFSYKNDIDSRISENNCLAWRGDNNIAFGSAGSLKASTIRSDILSIKKDE